MVVLDRVEELDLVARLGALADRIGERWRRVHRDENALPEIACEALDELPPPELDLSRFAAWALTSPRLPTQPSGGQTFGEPPVTVLIGDGFKIDILFWLDGTTTIHQHSFAGAFRVLAGSSVHGTYAFDPVRRVNSRLHLGRLSLTTTELLRPGDTRAIRPGSGLIHSLFHLDRPSVTLVVRTPGEEDVRPQFDYHRPGIALDADRAHPIFRKKVQVLHLLQRLGHPQLHDHLRLFLRRADLEATVRVLLDPRMVGLPVGEYVADEGRHEEARDWLVPAHDEAARIDRLISWRRLLDEPEHRFFLALLMNLGSRDDVLTFVRGRFAGDPIEHVLRWIGEIAAIQAVCAGIAPLLDVPLDDSARGRLGHVLGGAALAAADPLRTSSFLRPLLGVQ